MRDIRLALIREEKIKKVTNVAQAIFIVTKNAKDHIYSAVNDTDSETKSAENERGKSYTKTRVLNSLESATLDLLDVYYRQAGDWVSDMLRSMMYIRTLISLAQQTESVSAMNGEVLEKGLDFVSMTLEEKRQDRERVAAENRDREVALTIDLDVDNVSETETFNIHEKDITKEAFQIEKLKTPQTIKIAQTSQTIKTAQIPQISKETSRETESHNRQQNRRQEILDILSDTPISIKDISTHILGCSEKTIQRELNALLADRRIQKIGEKRWSRYLLK